MKQLIFILIVFVFFIGGCKKNSSGSKPSIELKRVSPDVVPINGSMQIILSYNIIFSLVHINHRWQLRIPLMDFALSALANKA